MTNQDIFPSSLSHVQPVHLSQLNTGILRELPGDPVVAVKTSSFRLRDIVCHFYSFTAIMYNQEGGGRIFQTSMLEVKLLNP